MMQQTLLKLKGVFHDAISLKMLTDKEVARRLFVLNNEV